MKELIEPLNDILWCLMEIREALKKTNPNSDVLTLREVAKEFKVSERTIKRRVENGNIPARRIWGKKNAKWLFSKKDLREFKNDCF